MDPSLGIGHGLWSRQRLGWDGTRAAALFPGHILYSHNWFVHQRILRIDFGLPAAITDLVICYQGAAKVMKRSYGAVIVYGIDPGRRKLEGSSLTGSGFLLTYSFIK